MLTRLILALSIVFALTSCGDYSSEPQKGKRPIINNTNDAYND